MPSLKYKKQINIVLSYIDNNIERPLTLDSLAAIAGFSKYHFHRIFKKLTGETVNGYVNRLRLEKSANIIVKNPTIKITELSTMLGYSSVSCFSRSFKKHFGHSPYQWKNIKHENLARIAKFLARKLKT